MTRDEAEAPPRKEPRGRVFRDEAYQVRTVGEQGRIRHPLDKLWLVWRAITKAASLAHSIMPAYESFKQSAVYAKYVGNGCSLCRICCCRYREHAAGLKRETGGFC